MKKKNISPNARSAFEDFKEEIAREMGIDINNKNEIVKNIIKKYEDSSTNLGRS